MEKVFQLLFLNEKGKLLVMEKSCKQYSNWNLTIVVLILDYHWVLVITIVNHARKESRYSLGFFV